MIYRMMADELLKIASDDKEPDKQPIKNDGAGRRLRIGGKLIGASALGFGLGAATGAGLAGLTDYTYKKVTGQPIPLKYMLPASTFLGGMSGLLLDHLRRKNLEDIKRAIESP